MIKGKVKLMSQFTLITGGARSGKSHFAELLAAHAKRKVIYIATAQIHDEEMALRVKKHRQQRPSSWQLIEEPLNIGDTLFQLRNEDAVILLDCVTLWLTNLLLAGQEQTLSSDSRSGNDETEILNDIKKVAQLAQEIIPQVIFVTNEVGQGIVPEYPLARAYRDLAGQSNQILAQHADRVFWVVAGCPIEVKQSSTEFLTSLHKE
jgi:adenosylcobinamide kinase/adenosylcobinamide-phosphate guanylyltransferase